MLKRLWIMSMICIVGAFISGVIISSVFGTGLVTEYSEQQILNAYHFTEYKSYVATKSGNSAETIATLTGNWRYISVLPTTNTVWVRLGGIATRGTGGSADQMIKVSTGGFTSPDLLQFTGVISWINLSDDQTPGVTIFVAR